jgi:hypothetical protein
MNTEKRETGRLEEILGNIGSVVQATMESIERQFEDRWAELESERRERALVWELVNE